MNLHKPLELRKARTERVELVPTKKFFKPVLVITAPVSIEEAELLGAGYLFLPNGAPREFEGAHKLKGELPGAKVTMAGETVSEILQSEKVAHLALYREEKSGMKLRLRIHVPEGDQLVELLAFLSQLNKDSFSVIVNDAQARLYEAADVHSKGGKEDPGHVWPLPDAQGNFIAELAIQRPFHNKKFKAAIYTLELESGYIFGWQVTAFAKDGEVLFSESRSLTGMNPVLNSESEARERAAAEALAFLTGPRAAAAVESRTYQKAFDELKDYLFDLAPGLARMPGEETRGE